LVPTVLVPTVLVPTVLVPIDVEEEGDGGINYILVAAVAVIVLALVVFFWGKIPGTSGLKPEAG